MKKITFSILLMACSICLYSQEFLWGANFSTKFDNREYSKMEASPSMTSYGAFLTPYVGLKFHENHKLILNADIARYFGNTPAKYSWELQFYYQCDSKHFDIFAGICPSAILKGDYNIAFVNDNILFFDRSIEGVTFRYKNDRGFSEVCLDWLSMRRPGKDEIIALYSASNYAFSWFNIGYSFTGIHYSWTDEALFGTTEDFQFYPYISGNFSHLLALDQCYIKAGWLQTFQRDRVNINTPTYPGGAMIDLKLQKWGVGLYNSLYIGKALMPYYYNSPTPNKEIYGGWLYSGDLFYNTDSGLYNKLEIYWDKKINKFLNFKLRAIMHIDGFGHTGWQQLATINVNIDSQIIKSKGKKRR